MVKLLLRVTTHYIQSSGIVWQGRTTFARVGITVRSILTVYGSNRSALALAHPSSHLRLNMRACCPYSMTSPSISTATNRNGASHQIPDSFFQYYKYFTSVECAARGVPDNDVFEYHWTSWNDSDISLIGFNTI